MTKVIPEPTWLVALITERIKEFDAALVFAKAAGYDVVMTPLIEPPEGEDIEIWEKTCDKCGEWKPETIRSGSSMRLIDGLQVLFAYGVCNECLGGRV